MFILELSRQDLEGIILFKEGTLKGYSRFSYNDLLIYVKHKYKSYLIKLLKLKNGLFINFDENE